MFHYNLALCSSNAIHALLTTVLLTDCFCKGIYYVHPSYDCIVNRLLLQRCILMVISVISVILKICIIVSGSLLYDGQLKRTTKYNHTRTHTHTHHTHITSHTHTHTHTHTHHTHTTHTHTHTHTPHTHTHTSHTHTQDCSTELEALGAGAPHAQTRLEKMEQVSRDVSRTSYKIQDELIGCAMGEEIQPNIKQKVVSPKFYIRVIILYSLVFKHPSSFSTPYLSCPVSSVGRASDF